jgi:hypothetical protein
MAHEKAPDNLAVTDLELASGVLRTGAMVRFQAVVRNFGRAAEDLIAQGLCTRRAA